MSSDPILLKILFYVFIMEVVGSTKSLPFTTTPPKINELSKMHN
jgi:hypothetical protein